MRKSYFNLGIDAFKEMFTKFIINRKKVKALENLSSCKHFRNKKDIPLMRQYVDSAFLEPIEQEFLDHIINKNFQELEYLAWSHKTSWLKETMQKVRDQFMPKPMVQPMFPWEKLDKFPEGQISEISEPASSRRKGAHV